MELHRSHRRFPRSAYMRRAGRMMDELWDWKEWYRQSAGTTQSPAIEAKLRERAGQCDDLYHALDEFQRTLWFVS